MPFQRGTDMPEDIDMAVRHTGWPGNLPPADGEQNGKEVVRQQAGVKAMQADIAFRVRRTVEGASKTESSMIAYGDDKGISSGGPGGMHSSTKSSFTVISLFSILAPTNSLVLAAFPTLSLK